MHSIRLSFSSYASASIAFGVAHSRAIVTHNLVFIFIYVYILQCSWNISGNRYTTGLAATAAAAIHNIQCLVLLLRRFPRLSHKIYIRITINAHFCSYTTLMYPFTAGSPSIAWVHSFIALLCDPCARVIASRRSSSAYCSSYGRESAPIECSPFR